MKNKYPKAKTAEELAKILGLSPADGLDIRIRSELNDKIIETVQKKRLTHAQVAKLAGTSRTRVTAMMNRNTMDISTDLLLRVLAAIGVEARLTFKHVA
jgi:predicted XRE-type DNA-binding protein